MKRIVLIALVVAIGTLLGGGCKPSQQANEMVNTIGVEEFAKVIAKSENIRLIDVRTPEEFAEEHLQGAENIDVKSPDFVRKIKDVKGKVAVYCRSGRRSLNAANQLVAQGCTVYDLRGGIIAWKEAGKPTTK